MKLTSLAVLSLLAALSFAPSSLASSNVYVATGVNYENPWESEFYFDSTKGSTLVNAGTSVNAFIEAWKANAAAHNGDVTNLTFLGEWAGRINTSSTWFSNPTNGNGAKLTAENIDAYAVNQLVNIIGTSGDTGTRSDKGMSLDGNMCWAHTAANMLQYWQCYYGVFATNAGNMRHGYAVQDAQTARTMLGVQSLNITKWYYDTFANIAGSLELALPTYLDVCKSGNWEAKSQDVFGDFFSTNSVTLTRSPRNVLELTQSIKELLGVQVDENGKVIQNVYGQLIGLDISSPESTTGSGHSLTLYGFGLNDSGLINRLIYANSNVGDPNGLKTAYVKETDGFIKLYEDKECTVNLEGKSESSWLVAKLTAINTPDLLKDMGRQYAEGDLVWMGGSTWKAGQGTGSMATAMPTDATGWQVSVNGTYYNSYFDASRNVRFNDDGHEENSTVSISGTATAHNMTIDAVKKNYSFSHANNGATDSILLTGNLIKSGAAKASFGLNISAAGLSVKGGTLAVGSGCVLTISGTSNIERGATLSMEGAGSASLGNATFAAGSVLSVSGTGNTINASSLTFADGARLSFDLSNPDAKSNTMLTINGAPNFGGKVYFDFVYGDETAKYKLIYFGSSVNSDCLKNFVSYNGDLSLDGNYLTLTYKQEQTATWNGGTSSRIWSSSSSSQWSSTPEGATVTFDAAHDGTVTVSGTVNPAAIYVTGGSYVFVSDATTTGVISGSRDLTISGGASLEAQMSLGEHAVVVKDSSSFTYNVDSTGSIDVSELRLEGANSSATFKGKATYDVHHASLSGKLSVQDTANLVLHSDADVASVTLKEQMGTDTQLSFRNSSNSGMVSYSLATDPSAGTINVGSADDTFGTRLNVSSAETTYTVARNSVLAIAGSEQTFKATGDGEVLVDQNATLKIAADSLSEVNVLVSSGKQATLVDYTESSSSSYQKTNPSFNKVFRIDGEVVHDHKFSSGDSKISFSDLYLNGGTYKLNSLGKSGTVTTDITRLNISGDSKIFQNNSPDTGTVSYYPVMEMVISSLEGSGNLSITREKITTKDEYGVISATNIKNLNDFMGGISFKAGLEKCFETCENALRLGGGRMSGALTVSLPEGSKMFTSTIWNTTAYVVIGGDVSIGGLDSEVLAESDSPNYNKIRLSGGEYSIGGFSRKEISVISPSDMSYNLTLDVMNVDEVHTFKGHVGNALDISKLGQGKQQFVGDLTEFNGNLEVKGGTLVMTSSTADGVKPDVSANASTLNVKKLGITGGAKLQAVLKNTSDSGADSALKIMVSGAFEARAYVSDLVGAAEAATLALDDAVGTNATENPVATINAALDLSNAMSLTFETGVDLGGQALTLWSGSTKDLTLSQSMGVSQEDGTYSVTLFTGVSSLDGAANGKTVKAQDLFSNTANLTENSTLVYNSTEKTIVLTSVTFDAPEPTTATLALLGLMGLCARRRRQK